MPAETPAATHRVRSDFDRIAALPDDPCDHRALARDLLPGARLDRHLFWRYSLVWRQPG